jgi:hypothetical protein
VRDEVNEPLGLPTMRAPSADVRPGVAWSALSATAALAIAVSALVFARREPPPRAEPIAAAVAPAALTAVPPVAVAKAAPAPARPAEAPPQPSSVSDGTKPAMLPPDSFAQIEAASGVKVARRGVAEAPRPLIINVAEALAAANHDSARGSVSPTAPEVVAPVRPRAPPEDQFPVGDPPR